MTAQPERAERLTIYPKYCHSLSPTFQKWCPLTATDVHALHQVGGFEGAFLALMSKTWLLDEMKERKLISGQALQARIFIIISIIQSNGFVLLVLSSLWTRSQDE